MRWETLIFKERRKERQCKWLCGTVLNICYSIGGSNDSVQTLASKHLECGTDLVVFCQNSSKAKACTNRRGRARWSDDIIPWKPWNRIYAGLHNRKLMVCG
jgi:hypothetical protein